MTFMDENAFIQELYHLIKKYFIDIKKFSIETEEGKNFTTVSHEQLITNLEALLEEIKDLFKICNLQKKEQTQQLKDV